MNFYFRLHMFPIINIKTSSKYTQLSVNSSQYLMQI